METIGDRIKKIRKEKLHRTQKEFGDCIGLKPNSVSDIENGKNNPTQQTIKAICREFSISEQWLQTGNGDMNNTLPPADEVMAAITNVLEDVGYKNSTYTLVKEFLLKYDRLDPKSKEVINKFADDVVNGYIEKREDT